MNCVKLIEASKYQEVSTLGDKHSQQGFVRLEQSDSMFQNRLVLGADKMTIKTMRLNVKRKSHGEINEHKTRSEPFL
jgi:hypothetical protein